jgi:hypothetical protein
MRNILKIQVLIYLFSVLFVSCVNNNEPTDKTTTNLAGNLPIDIAINNIAGSLHKKLNTQRLDTITHLSIKGTIDARDFRILRDSMPLL